MTRPRHDFLTYAPRMMRGGAAWWWWTWAALVAGAGAASPGSLPPHAWHHRAVMDQRGAYVMLWTAREDSIVVEVQVATQGYVGLGFSPTGGMKGADVVLGWVDAAGTAHLQDRFAFGHLTPSLDRSQDYLLLGGYQNDSHTVLRFSRPWVTCDDHHDYKLKGDTVRVIWAYDNEDPDGSERLNRHDQRGGRSIYLRDPHLAPPSTHDPHTLYWDVLSPQVQLPDHQKTLYWCKLYKIPPLRQKAHMIGYVPQIEESNRQHVHHMLLYECHLSDTDKHLDRFSEAKGTQCYDRNMPASWFACSTPIVAWAVGSEGEMYPEHVGIPFGEEHGGATYFMLEIHYDNPNLRTGVVDSSGVRILYTYDTRQHDAGIITLGHTVSPELIIPPGQHWNTVAQCTAACTDKTLPESGINVFHGVLHAHLLASSISVQQIRSGRELPPVFKDEHYDFNYQQARVLKEEMVILPGDSLIVTCGYDSAKRKNPTFGGFSTEDEMCLAFLAYYPRVNLSGCYSKPDLALIFDTFGIQDLYNNNLSMFNHQYFSESQITEASEEQLLMKMKTKDDSKHVDIHLPNIYHYVIAKAPAKYNNTSFYDILYNKTTWQDKHLMATLQEMTTYEQHEPSCDYHGRTVVEGIPKKTKYPDFIPFKSQQQECTSSKKHAEMYKPKQEVPPFPTKTPRMEQDGDATPAATLPSFSPEENELERDSLTQRKSGGGRAGVGCVVLALLVCLSVCCTLLCTPLSQC